MAQDDFCRGRQQRIDDEPLVELNTDMRTVVVVDNIPKVTEEKFEKLSNMLVEKIFGAYGKLLQYYIPQEMVGNDLVTVGYVFPVACASVCWLTAWVLPTAGMLSSSTKHHSKQHVLFRRETTRS